MLAYLLDELPRRLGHPVRFDIVTGTSVGAIHACYVAAMQGEEDSGARLAEIWRSFSLDRVLPVHPADLLRVPWRLSGLGSVGALLSGDDEHAPERLPGLFDTTWLESLVLNQVPWSRIRANIAAGELRALAIAATEIATGRSVVFVEDGDVEPRLLHVNVPANSLHTSSPRSVHRAPPAALIALSPQAWHALAILPPSPLLSRHQAFIGAVDTLSGHIAPPLACAWTHFSSNFAVHLL